MIRPYGKCFSAWERKNSHSTNPSVHLTSQILTFLDTTFRQPEYLQILTKFQPPKTRSLQTASELLRRLNKSGIIFEWSTEAEQAFAELKARFTITRLWLTTSSRWDWANGWRQSGRPWGCANSEISKSQRFGGSSHCCLCQQSFNGCRKTLHSNRKRSTCHCMGMWKISFVFVLYDSPFNPTSQASVYKVPRRFLPELNGGFYVCSTMTLSSHTAPEIEIPLISCHDILTNVHTILPCMLYQRLWPSRKLYPQHKQTQPCKQLKHVYNQGNGTQQSMYFPVPATESSAHLRN